MSINKTTRSITLAIIFAAYLSSTVANAEPGQQSGARRGPPPQAFDACADQPEGADCRFTGHRGDVTGSCIVPRQEGHAEELVCAPEGGPPRDREPESFDG